MEKEKNIAVKIAIITGIFGIIVAMINILPDILRKSKHDIAVAVNVRPLQPAPVVPVKVKQPDPVKVKQPDPVKVKQPDPVKVKQPDPAKTEENQRRPQPNPQNINQGKKNLAQVTREVISLFALECQDSSPTQILLGKITYQDTDLVGPIAFEIRNYLIRAISESHKLEYTGVKYLQRAVKRGVKVIGAHRIEVSYFGKGKQVLVDFFFKKPNGTIRKKCRIELAGANLPALLPPMRGKLARP